jgi:hypothetical protein
MFLRNVLFVTSLMAGLGAAQELIDLLPGCAQLSTFAEAATCFFENTDPQCFNESSPAMLLNCFVDEYPAESDANITGIAKDLVETAAMCFEPYVGCIRARVEDAVAQLPACVPETGKALVQCFLDNAEACSVSCNDTAWESPFAQLDPDNLMFCWGIERDIVFPMCQVVDCCPPCVDPLEDLTECVVNDALGHTLFDCNFECDDAPSSVGNRRRHLEGDDTEAVVTDRATEIFDTCVSLTPGLLGSQQGAQQLAIRSNFFDCVMEGALTIEEAALGTTGAPTAVPSAAADMAHAFMLAGTLLLGSVWMIV